MSKEVGISGFAVYVPPYRVDLKDWCDWTASPWEKTSAVIGPGSSGRHALRAESYPSVTIESESSYRGF